MEKLFQFIRDFEKRTKEGRSSDAKLFGGCFGCQAIGHALGGTVDRNPCGNFISKTETLQFTKEFGRWNCAKENGAHKDNLKVLQSHGDCVLELPLGSVLLATSQSNQNEMFKVGESVLAFQGHPEFHLKHMGSGPVENVHEFSTEDHQNLMNIIQTFLRS